MPAVVVTGTQWGDEGKGKIIDLLAADADVVVRFHGGNNAGHTLVVNGEKTILNLIPAGVLHPGRICVMGPGMVIDPEVLVGEIDALRRRGYLGDDRWLRISEQAHLIMPYHRAIDRARERLRGPGNIGTTGRGIGPAYEDKMARTGIRVGELFDEPGFRAALERNLREKNGYLQALLGEPPLAFDDIHDRYRGYRERLRPFVADTTAELRAAGDEYGATTGRPRRCGWFDAVVVRHAIALSGVDGLALTKLDVLTGLDPLRVCVAYELDGRRRDFPPATQRGWERVVPLYEELAGWRESLGAVRALADLPPNARRYLDRLSALVGTPVVLLSVGPQREQTIRLGDVF